MEAETLSPLLTKPSQLEPSQLVHSEESDLSHSNHSEAGAASLASSQAASAVLNRNSNPQVRRQAAGVLAAPHSNSSLARMAGTVQRAPAAAPAPPQAAQEAYSDEDAAAVKDLWATTAYTVTDSGQQQESKDYYLWKKSAKKLLTGKALTKDQKKTLTNWIKSYEAHEAWLLRKEGAEPATPEALAGEITGAEVSKGHQLGAAPSPAFSHKKMDYKVTMPGAGGSSYSFRDNPIRPDYQYLINDTGVAKEGQKVANRTDLEDVYKVAGISDATVKKVMTKVSSQEGGFEAVNTYDTGYVSVGFIQFITAVDGKGSVLSLLKTMKESFPDEFAKYFHKFGIDVDSKGLVVVDPADGKQLRGEKAVRKIMDDKRLTAVFHDAGLHSRQYQATQLKIAREQYYLAPQHFSFKVKVDGQEITFSGAYEDVLQSEAGKTAIMDRAVQKGAGSSQKVFKNTAIALIKQHKLKTVAELAQYETVIAKALINRINVLKETDLSQPAAAPS